jgi:hypothetical protein
MNESRLKTIGGLTLGALAVICLTPGTEAKACSLPNSIALRSANLPNSSLLKFVVPQDASGTPAQRGGGTPASVEGLWQVTYSSSGQIVDMAFEVFHSDGTEMLNDITPPAEGNVCLGVWTQTASTTYKLTHPSWLFDSNGNLTGTSLFNVTVALDSADKFTGTYTLNYYDSEGNLGPVYTGTMTATRIQSNY